MNLLVIIILSAIVLPTAYVWLKGAPTVSTAKSRIAEIISTAQISEKDTVCDLGAGIGNVMIGIAQKTGARVIGYELAPISFLIGWLNIKLRSLNNCELHFGDLFKANLSSTTVVFCFLMPKMLPRLRDKIRLEARSDTKIISFAFPVPELTPYATIQDNKKPAVYFYKIAG